VQVTNEQVQFGQGNQPYTVPSGVGSGVILDAAGHILTNDHVIEGAQQLLVSLPDGRAFPATLVGSDPITDLAVIKVDAADLPVARLGDATKLQVGDWVVAIGNALALEGGPTVTEGVVSALGRTVQEPGSTGASGPFLFDVIQTSAPINPGNSGGALVNMAGEVIGINTLVAGVVESGVQAEGIGFAISITTAKPVADELIADGKVEHAYLGISYAPLTPSIAAQLGIDVTGGVVIGNVVSRSPADDAGLLTEDVITQVGGEDVVGDSGLPSLLREHQPGETVKLTVVRGGRTIEVSVKLGSQP